MYEFLFLLLFFLCFLCLGPFVTLKINSGGLGGPDWYPQKSILTSRRQFWMLFESGGGSEKRSLITIGFQISIS